MLKNLCNTNNLRDISLSDIDFGATDLSVRYSIDKDVSLVRSIKKHGLLAPVILVDHGKKYIILSGFKRLYALRFLKKRCCCASVLALDTLSRRDLFIAALHANYGQSYREIDVMYILHKARDLFDFSIDEMIGEIVEAIGTVPSRKVIENYIHAFSIDDQFKQMMCAGTLAFKGAYTIAEYPPDIQRLVYQSIFKKCLFTASDIKNMFEYFQIIKRREKISYRSLLKRKYVQIILKDPSLVKKQKAEALLKVLKEYAFPCTETVRKNFKEVKKRLKLSRAITFDDPEDFEKSHFRIGIDFRSKAELRTAIKNIDKKADIIEALFDMDSACAFKE